MLALEMAANWLSGRMLPASTSAVGDTIQDIFGSALAVGNKVKFIGTIVSINPSDAHFQDIVVRPDYPGIVGPVSNMDGPAPLQKPVSTYGFHPLMLVKVGSSL
jgi:hypothetical protein